MPEKPAPGPDPLLSAHVKVRQTDTILYVPHVKPAHSMHMRGRGQISGRAEGGREVVGDEGVHDSKTAVALFLHGQQVIEGKGKE